jgi:AcrR family transcriptional regulator
MGTLDVSGEVSRERQVADHDRPRDVDPPTSSRYRRLRPGPGLSREIVESHQRTRLQQAIIELVATDGYGALTVRRLAKRARISSGTFYSHYRSTDDCLLSTFDLVCQRASQRMVEVGQNEPEPRRRLDLAVNRLFQDMVAAPQIATFMLRAAPAVGPAFTSALRNSTMRLGVALEFCIRSGNSPPPHPLLLEGMVAGLARIGRLLVPTTPEDEIGELAAEAVEWIISLDVSSARGGEPLAAVSPGSEDDLPAPGPLSNGGWEGALGDERTMILAAALRISKSGYHQLTVSEICRQAGVSRRAFNRYFESLEDCFISALEERATGAIAASIRERPASTTWSCAVYEVLQTLCSGIEADPEGAQVLFVEITAAGTEGIESRDRLISQAARALRATAPEGRGPSELAAEASAAAAWVILRQRVQDQSATMSEALPVLTLLILAPRQEGRWLWRGQRDRDVDREI